MPSAWHKSKSTLFFGDNFRDREAVGKARFLELIAMPWALLAPNLAANGLSAAPKRGPNAFSAQEL